MKRLKNGLWLGLLAMAAVFFTATVKPVQAAHLPQTVDITANTAVVKTATGEVLEACVITVLGETYPLQLGSCKELGEGVLQQLQHDYPTVVFNLTVNGYAYNKV